MVVSTDQKNKSFPNVGKCQEVIKICLGKYIKMSKSSPNLLGIIYPSITGIVEMYFKSLVVSIHLL